MFKNAKVGDRVWGIQGGEAREDGTNGEIIEIAKSCLYPIGVDFDNKVRIDCKVWVYTYTTKGYRLTADGFPSLFWRKPDMEIPPEPERELWGTIRTPMEIIGVDCFDFIITIENQNYVYGQRMGQMSGKRIKIKPVSLPLSPDYRYNGEGFTWMENWLKDISEIKEGGD